MPTKPATGYNPAVSSSAPASAAGSPAPAASNGKALPLALAAAVLLGLAAAFGVNRAVASPSPFGTPLPALPAPLYESEGVSVNDTSVIDGRIAPELLHVLAFQPDGAPPLRYPYPSEHGDFDMQFVTGTESVIFDNASFLKDGIESQANVKFKQPLRLVKISLLLRPEGESLTTYVSRICNDLRRQGAEFYPDTKPLELPAYRFEHFEHKREVDGAMISNFTYVGPYGRYVVVIQFSTLPEMHERCRPYVEKSMRSFEPGWKSKKAMLMEDPTYGEYAGTGLLEREL